MNVRLIKLTKEYYHQLADMIDEWKLDQETIEAIEESIRLANDNSKGYSNIEDLKNALGL